MNKLSRQRTLDEWLFHPTFEESICVNHFHTVAKKVYEGISEFDPYAPDQNDIST